MPVGRELERERLHRLLAGARAGRGGALAIRGEAGIGKTTLLDQAATDGRDLRTVRAAGVESEAELPFGGLHLLLLPFVDRLDALPERQASALRSAFGLAGAPAPDRFLVGAATLTLLSELAADRPLLCLVDDAQWLDLASSDALLFAARRLGADPVALVFAVRDEARPFPMPGLDVLRLGGLDPASAAGLLDDRVPGLTAPARERLLAEAGGNPLALIELATALRAEEGRAESVHRTGPLQVTGQVLETFRERVAEMPATTRLLLVVVAADGTADPGVVLRAAGALGLSAVDLGPAEDARLVVLDGTRVRFRHPLIRSAAYQSAPHHQRIAAHDALARALDGAEHADRRAWHRAAAATGPDEEVAAELERAAHRARDRGGTAAVAAAYERAARLGSDPAGKARRIAGAARAAYDAGRLDWASRLAAEAASLTGEPRVAAEAIFIRAQVAYERTSPAADAALALEGAALVAAEDPEQAASMLTEAVWAARDAGDHALVGQSVRLLETLEPRSVTVAALIGYGALADGAPERAAAPMAALVAAAGTGAVAGLVERVIAGFMGLLVASDAAGTAVLEALTAEVRADGALGWLPYALEPLAIGRFLTGDPGGAAASVAEGIAIASDIGMDTQVTALRGISAWLAATAGDAAGCRELAAGVLDRAELHPTNAALASWGLGLLDLAAGRAEAALDRLEAVCAGPARHDLLVRAVPDQVEAAVRSGRADRAGAFLPAFERWAAHTGSPVAAALMSRCRALLSTGDEAEAHYAAALGDRPSGPRHDGARTRLLYGEWLRRRRRRTDARDQLVQAHDAFARLGAPGWAGRARAELEALGDRPTASPHDADLTKRLTPQELQVVRLAAAGHSNREIGAQLFLSPRTIGHHLYRAFPKIGVTRRAELSQLDL